MTQVPALRAALREAADRRYGRPRFIVFAGRAGVAFATATAVAAAGWVAITVTSDRKPSQPPAETTVSPTATAAHTTKITPVPTPTVQAGGPRIIQPRLLDATDAEATFAADTDTSAKLVHAWSTPGMQGERAHVFLYRKGSDWCLSVPDPGGEKPGDRGVSCSSDATFKRFGVSGTVGSSYAAVLGPGRPAPTYRRPDGSRQMLEVADGGLVAIANVGGGSAVALHDANGNNRTDGFRVPEPRTRYDCSNGGAVEMPTTQHPAQDPCAGFPASSATPVPPTESSAPLPLDGRGN
jgi:hypothetical protein